MKNPNISMSNLEASLRIASIVFKTASTISKPVWSDFIVIFPTLLDKEINATSTQNIVLNEEMKLYSVKCVKALLQKPAIDIATFPLPIMAQIITQLLDMSSRERLLELQEECLATLALIIEIQKDVKVLQQFLPGIISGLTLVAVRDRKDHHKVIVGALGGISGLLCKALNDRLLDTIGQTGHQSMHDLIASIQTPQQPNPLPPLITKSLQPLGQAIDTITTTLQTHLSPFVRLALVQFSADIVRDCSHTLSTSVPRLVESLISYYDDPDPLVSQECHARIKHVVVTPIIKSSFQSHIQRMPRMVERGSEEEKLSALSIASGYLVLLDKECAFSLSLALEKLTPGLLHALTLETSDIGLIADRVPEGLLDTLNSNHNVGHSDENASYRNNGDKIGGQDGTSKKHWSNVVTFPRRRFVYFRDEGVEARLNGLLRKMMQYGDVCLLFDHFSSLFRVDEQPLAKFIQNVQTFSLNIS